MTLNLDPKYYFQPAIFLAEREKIFSRTWQLIGPTTKLQHSGDYVSEDIAGIKIIVIRSSDGKLRGFKNVCRHRGAQILQRGEGTCRTLRCPYHNWSYSDQGNLLTTPWYGEDQQLELEDWPLHSISVEVWRNLVFACIEPQQSLQHQLGDACAEFSDIPMETYQCEARETLDFVGNWKIYTDNFVEGYHIPGIHPAFYQAIDFEKFETTAHNGIVKMTAPAKTDLFYKGRWYWMWPNWTLSLFDGGMNTSRINPIDETRTELIYHFYFDQEYIENKQHQQQTIKRNLSVIKEDFDICRQTHENYQSGNYQSGPLSPRHEQGVMWFQDEYRRWAK